MNSLSCTHAIVPLLNDAETDMIIDQHKEQMIDTKII